MEFNLKKSEQLAKKIRLNAVKMTNAGKSSHIGSVLSMADIMAVLYGSVLNINPDDPEWKERDRFILSKGHAGAGVYASLAELGFFPKAKLETHYQDGSDLSGHVSHKGIPGVELSTGSLGHGLPVACGIALALKIDSKDSRVFVLLGDGECNEGSNWESFLFAPHHKLGNLVVIVDRNRLQSIYTTEKTLKLEPLGDKLKMFGWDVLEVDGHNHNELYGSFLSQKSSSDKPLFVIANTTKGKGVSFMEDKVLWHYRSPQDNEFDDAITELNDDA
jgi:transketolase